MAINQVDRIVRVTWLYNLIIGSTVQDTSQHSVTFRAGAVPSSESTLNAVLQDMATAAAASQVANFTQAWATSGVQAEHVRVALEDVHGKTLAEQFRQCEGDYAWVGAGSGLQLPWECAVAISLYAHQPGTFATLGKSKRGRFYLPSPHAGRLATDHSGQLTLGDMQDVRDSWAQILRELQEHDYSGFPSFSPELVVNSRHLVEAFPVTFIRIDTKVDSQRRRQRQEETVVSYAAWPPTG